jgi:hypothetical protein
MMFCTGNIRDSDGEKDTEDHGNTDMFLRDPEMTIKAVAHHFLNLYY